eukprot:6168811-Prymnesium_polylepis.1
MAPDPAVKPYTHRTVSIGVDSRDSTHLDGRPHTHFYWLQPRAGPARGGAGFGGGLLCARSARGLFEDRARSARVFFGRARSAPGFFARSARFS